MIKYFEDTLNIIKPALESVGEEEFSRLLDECNQTLNNSRRIIVSGLGKNVPICDKFVGTMVSMGMEAAFLHTNSAVHGDMGIVRDGDLVIILTKSGSTSESVYLKRELEKRDITMWLLTFGEGGELAKEMDNVLSIQLSHEGDMWDIVPNNSTVLNLIVLQTLAMELAKMQNITLEQFRMNHPGGHIGEILKN